MSQNLKAVELKKEGYTIQVKYSEEAIEKKLVKFITKNGDEFSLSADEIISILVNQVNMDTLSPTFVESEKINVVEVFRQIQCKLERDWKKGEVININYTHPYPVEFALIEEAHKIAKINDKAKVFELSAEFLAEVKKKITPASENFVKKFYKSFKGLNLEKKN